MSRFPRWLRPRPAIIIPSATLIVGLILLIVTPIFWHSPIRQALARNLPDVLRYQQPVNLTKFSALIGQPTNMTPLAPSKVAPCPAPTTAINLKVLLISADGNEVDLPAIEQELNYLGTPYTLYITTKNPGQLTPDKLSNNCSALYEGVILTTGSLAYLNNGTWMSGLTAAEWTNLWDFEAKFRLRQVSWYTYPTADFGFRPASAAISTNTQPYSTTYTAAAKAAFPYANTANPLPIQYAYTYLAQPLDTKTVPLLTDTQGDALAAIRTYPDGRQNLALTFDSNAYLVHTLVLGPGLINWVTKGIAIGDHQTYLESQIDDFFLDDFTWQPTTPCGSNLDLTGVSYRITGADLKAVVAWQNHLQTNPVTRNVRLDMTFNGYGATPGAYEPDSLTFYAKTVQGKFYWTNHTFDHLNLDAVDYNTALSEIGQNITEAQTLKLRQFTPLTMVTPDVSGLTNPNFLQAAYDSGIRYLVTDTSRPSYNNPYANAGIFNPLQSQILMIPRHPTNLFFNVSMPNEWVAEYNCLYRAYWGQDLTYPQILDQESNTLLGYLLRGEMDPEMYHQPNLRAYDGTHTLLTDLLDATFAKYEALVSTPIHSLRMDQVGQNMTQIMQLHGATITASYTPGVGVTLTADQAVTVPLTGARIPGAISNGFQRIGYITLNAGISVIIPVI